MNKERATLKAVVAYAEQLRNKADKTIVGDPYARPYYPTTAAARLAYYNHLAGVRRGDLDENDADLPEEDQKHLAAERALNTLFLRARKEEREADEQNKEAERAARRLARQRRQWERDRDAERAGLTVGQRIDRALAGFCTIAAPAAASVGSSSGRGDPRTMPSDYGDPGGEADYLARQTARRLEEMLDRARARDVGKAA